MTLRISPVEICLLPTEIAENKRKNYDFYGPRTLGAVEAISTAGNEYRIFRESYNSREVLEYSFLQCLNEERQPTGPVIATNNFEGRSPIFFNTEVDPGFWQLNKVPKQAFQYLGVLGFLEMPKGHIETLKRKMSNYIKHWSQIKKDLPEGRSLSAFLSEFDVSSLPVADPRQHTTLNKVHNQHGINFKRYIKSLITDGKIQEIPMINPINKDVYLFLSIQEVGVVLVDFRR